MSRSVAQSRVRTAKLNPIQYGARWRQTGAANRGSQALAYGGPLGRAKVADRVAKTTQE